MILGADLLAKKIVFLVLCGYFIRANQTGIKKDAHDSKVTGSASFLREVPSSEAKFIYNYSIIHILFYLNTNVNFYIA